MCYDQGCQVHILDCQQRFYRRGGKEEKGRAIPEKGRNQ